MTGTSLHLIHPLGFHLDEKSLKRSGMDYWKKIDVRQYTNFADFIAQNPDANIFLAETGGQINHTQANFAPGDFIIFGSETKGLPSWILQQYHDKIISIPMTGDDRSLNLSVSVGIILYEALRQTGFPNLTTK